MSLRDLKLENLPATGTSLASRMGEASHFSPLLRKIKRLSGHTDVLPFLMELAVSRGAKHYQNVYECPQDFPETLQSLCNEELAIALCLGELRYDPNRIRIAGAVFGADTIDADRVLKLARQERCEAVVKHIADCGIRVEPQNLLWTTLSSNLPTTDASRLEFLPGWTRFVSMTGFTRNGGKDIRWLRIYANQ